MKAIKLDNIGYMPIPKIACTSIKETFFQLKENREYDSKVDPGEHIHNYWKQNYQDISRCDFRFVIIRDPIKRFLSAYGNRVCFHRELSFNKLSKSCPDIINSFDVYSPGVGEFIDNFYLYNQVPSINHHCKPISEWVQGDLSFYTNIYPLEKIHDFELKLGSLLEQTIIFPREQTEGRKVYFSDLNREQVDFLLEFYREDYRLLKKYYSIDAFWTEWKRGV